MATDNHLRLLLSLAKTMPQNIIFIAATNRVFLHLLNTSNDSPIITLRISALPYGERCGPVPFPRECPVLTFLDPFAESSLTDVLWLPINLIIISQHLLVDARHAYKPRIFSVIKQRRITTPAERIVVLVILGF